MDKAAASQAFAPAALEALKAFPIDPDAVALVSVSENVTFRVTDKSGEAYVLRLHRPGYHTLEALNGERLWTRALAKAGVAVPIPLNARDGRDYVSVFVPATGEHRQAGMTRWTDGDLLDEVLKRKDDTAAFEHWFEKLGALVATMHNQSSAWRPPPAFQRRALDADGLMGEAPFWGPFWEHPKLSEAERRLFLETRGRLHAVLDRHGREPSTYGVIHADLHPGNLLVGGDKLTVIDFDDAAFGWHQYDLAVALIRHQSRPDFAAIEAACLRGYRGARDLPEPALDLVPMFRLVRGLAQIGWLHQRPEIDPGERFYEMKNEVCAQCETFEPPR